MCPWVHVGPCVWKYLLVMTMIVDLILSKSESEPDARPTPESNSTPDELQSLAPMPNAVWSLATTPNELNEGTLASMPDGIFKKGY